MSNALRIRRGLFERLLATDPDAPEGLIQTCSVEQLRDTVAGDLERLLNARSALLSSEADVFALGPQARSSVVCFGVPDFAGRVLASSEDRRFIATSLAKAIEAHEPRLRHVAVEFGQDDVPGRALQFTIRATLVVRPARESVSFDAVLVPSMSRYRVTQARFAPAGPSF
jgi:type VI secretion system protein ImpF